MSHDRGKDMGDMRAIRAKIAARYDPGMEEEVRGWFQQLVGITIEEGPFNVEKQLKDGTALLKLIAVIFEKTPNKPAGCSKCDIKINTMKVHFKQMENINKFLKAAEVYGVPKGSLFQTPDLFEGRNMAQVLSTITLLGTETRRHNMDGPKIGPNPTEKNVRHFDEETLQKGKTIIGLQAGTNKCASQKGMSFGSSRHVADIAVDKMDQAGQAIMGGQAGFKDGASQKGMAFGAVRHVADIDSGPASKESQGHIGGQAGYTGGDSQKGMSFGSVRHVSDIDSGPASKESQSYIGGQAGYTGGDSQKGMSFGAVRHVNDIDAGNMSQEGQSIIGGQSGWNQGDSQSGMAYGRMRHAADTKVEDISAESKAAIGLQMGSSDGASQSGMSMGKQRMIVD